MSHAEFIQISQDALTDHKPPQRTTMLMLVKAQLFQLMKGKHLGSEHPRVLESTNQIQKVNRRFRYERRRMPRWCFWWSTSIVGPTTKDKRLVIFPATCKRNDMLILTIQPTSQKAYQWNINLSVLFGAASTTGSLMLQTNPNQRLRVITENCKRTWNTGFLT